jgi:hypothetical protein
MTFLRNLRMGRLCLCITVCITSLLLGCVTVVVLREGTATARFQQAQLAAAAAAAGMPDPHRLGMENEPVVPADPFTALPDENEEEHAYEESESNHMRSLNSLRDREGRHPVTAEPRMRVYRQLRSFLKIPTAPASLLDTDAAARKFSTAGQDEAVHRLLHEKHGGFFVDIGAGDGMTGSNTLWLERQHGWTGLLVEADPANCRAIDALNRNSWRLCACLAKDDSQEVARASATAGGLTGLRDPRKLPRAMGSVQTPCFPLQEAMTTLDVQQIDFVSISGPDAVTVLDDMRDFLKSGRVLVDTFSIHYRAPDNDPQASYDRLTAIRHFFLEVGGFMEWGRLSSDHQFDDLGGQDVVYVRSTYLDAKN